MSNLHVIAAIVVALLSAQAAFLALIHGQLARRPLARERDEDAEPTVVLKVGREP